MFKNLLKTAFRNLWKNKVFSLINIVGLSIGLSASFVIGAIIYFDLTFDKFHSEGDRIYRVTSEFTSPEGSFYNSGVCAPLADVLETSATGIATVSQFFTDSPYRVENRETEKVFMEPKNVIYADTHYFEIFKYNWLTGDEKTALSEPNEVVMSADRVQKYFPGLSPSEVMGKLLVYNDTIPIKVAGVIENFKNRSDLIFEEFISIKTLGTEGLKSMMGDDWNSTSSASQLFIKMDRKAIVTPINQLLDDLAREHQDKVDLAYNHGRIFHLQPLSDLHFNTDYGTFDYSRSQASKPVLISLAFVALFLLLLGCINFINLNTAQATQRAKEIGIRKTLGSSRKQLIFQFLGETFLLTTASAVLSLLFASWLLRLFADFMPQGVNFGLFKSPMLVVAIILLLFVLTILAGFYPALVLSHFKPVAVLKNQIIQGSDKGSLRKYLTVLQFVIAQIFIIATLLVAKQIHFLMTKDMGFKTDAIAYIQAPFNENSTDQKIRFVEGLKALPEIQSVTQGGNPPASRSTHSTEISYRDGEKEIHSEVQLLFGDASYQKAYKLKLLAGRMPLNDTIHEYVINKTYMKQLGFEVPEDAIGKKLGEGKTAYPIVGVMDDFYQRSLRTEIKPMALIGDWSREEFSQFNTFHIVFGGDTATWVNTLASIEKVWKSVYPDYDFDPRFIDDTVKKFYEQEHKTSVLLQWATGLAILISCLGLLGLVIHTTERRTKEIGIRKVLGASLSQLNLLLCKDFLILVGIAFVVAVPIAWWGLDKWLQDFAYKTDLSWWIFVVSGIAMLLIALSIISLRTIAAANRNPVKSLQTE
jgi:ABC-type antimicrobial peptide transport system permease subunit